MGTSVQGSFRVVVYLPVNEVSGARSDEVCKLKYLKSINYIILSPFLFSFIYLLLLFDYQSETGKRIIIMMMTMVTMVMMMMMMMTMMTMLTMMIKGK